MSDAPIKLSLLMDNFGDDHEFLNDIYSTYMQDCSERMITLEKAVANGDASECSSLAHAIKGASSNVGAVRVEPIAGEMEHEANASDMSGASEKVKLLRVEFDQAVEFLTEFLTTLNP